jgi:CO dehydrogenase/acetyl-CoA synthase alpha subunit
MALDGATLVARGSGDAGEQPNPVAAQYQKTATAGLASTAIHPADYSQQVTLGGPVMNVIGTVPPGKTGITLVKGVIQNSTDLISNNQPLGNTLPSSNRPTATGDPVENVAQQAAAGLSLAANHE